jgi:hypothetical protein
MEDRSALCLKQSLPNSARLPLCMMKGTRSQAAGRGLATAMLGRPLLSANPVTLDRPRNCEPVTASRRPSSHPLRLTCRCPNRLHRMWPVDPSLLVSTITGPMTASTRPRNTRSRFTLPAPLLSALKLSPRPLSDTRWQCPGALPLPPFKARQASLVRHPLELAGSALHPALAMLTTVYKRISSP